MVFVCMQRLYFADCILYNSVVCNVYRKKVVTSITAQKIKFPIKDFFRKYETPKRDSNTGVFQ